MAGHVYDFILADGQKLGDLTVDQVTEQMIGAVLDALRTTGGTAKAKSLAVQEQIRQPAVGRQRKAEGRGDNHPGPQCLRGVVVSRSRRDATQQYATTSRNRRVSCCSI